MAPLVAGLALAVCLLAAARAETDFKDCHNISRLVTEGDDVVVPLNTSEVTEVAKWNSTHSSWELVLLINNGKSRLLNSKFTDQFTVFRGHFIVMNVSREAQGVYRVKLSLSGKCVALINLTVQAPTVPPLVIPRNQAPAAHPALWALLLIPIIVAIIIIYFCCTKILSEKRWIKSQCILYSAFRRRGKTPNQN